jgi:hypothetical protein
MHSAFLASAFVDVHPGDAVLDIDNTRRQLPAAVSYWDSFDLDMLSVGISSFHN